MGNKLALILWTLVALAPVGLAQSKEPEAASTNEPESRLPWLKKEDRPGRQWFDYNPHNQTSRRNRKFTHMPKPFLMAGDPKFGEMLKLALMSKEELEAKISQWPHFAKMDKETRKKFEEHLSRFRLRIHNEASQESKNMDLNLGGDKLLEFTRAYWTDRIAVESRIRAEAEKQWDQAMNEARQKLKNRFLQEGPKTTVAP